ncbi:MAG: hypothetical protein BEN19_01545 [Epulopiscium sp. Nuni2H_MBin003]|nr:MAG: hypothetical protein BEN19_01545 [Epulopiscium sp. Nuni2H_MBin003]
MIDYMQVLIWTMLFVVVVEMIFPNSHLKKYIKLILGFIVIYNMIAPIINGGIFERGPYDEYVTYYQEQFDLVTDKGIQIEGYEKQLQESFIQIEAQKITQNIEKELELVVENVTVSAQMQDYTPHVTDIDLTLSHKKEDTAIMIPTIKIGEKDESIGISEQNLQKEVKNVLSDFYNLDNVNIYIVVQDVK